MQKSKAKTLKLLKKIITIGIPIITIIGISNYLSISKSYKQLQSEFTNNIYRKISFMLDNENNELVDVEYLKNEVVYTLASMADKYNHYVTEIENKNFENISKREKEIFLEKYEKIFFEESTESVLDDNIPLGKTYRGPRVSLDEFLDEVVNLKEGI